jgi:mRNA interferase MazF
LKRGEIWDIQYPLTERSGSEPYRQGPIVIVSSSAFNQSAIQTVMVAVITSNLKLARAPGNILVPASKITGLRNDSVINVSQILVVNKTRLVVRRGQLDDINLELLDLGLRKVFDLE